MFPKLRRYVNEIREFKVITPPAGPEGPLEAAGSSTVTCYYREG